MDIPIQLTDQVAIVTGGGHGLGRAMAQTLAAAGIAVAVVDLSSDQLDETIAPIKQSNGHAIALMADVTDQQAVQRMVSETEQKLGPVDVLVNNAGISGPIGPTWEIDPDDWWRVIDVNLRGPFLCSRTVLPGMITRRHGQIINVASGASIRPVLFNSQYGASKTALVRFTENLAFETQEYGISVFSVRPGVVRTGITEYMATSPEGQKWKPEIREQLDKGMDLPPERIAQLVLLLASGKANALSGRYFSVHDDMDDLLSRIDEIKRNDLLTLRLRTFSQ
ncbi:MAG: SDR family oxidoreductase [Gammaproteobacteria bacterium]|nr:SDR family oxidoreductase [Gammaproteobacteria bacterium]